MSTTTNQQARRLPLPHIWPTDTPAAPDTLAEPHRAPKRPRPIPSKR